MSTQTAKRVEVVQYGLFFERTDHEGTGLEFPCDASGNLFELTPQDAATVEGLREEVKTGKFKEPWVRTWRHSFIGRGN